MHTCSAGCGPSSFTKRNGRAFCTVISCDEELTLDKIRELTPRSWGQSLRNCFEKINEYFRGWVGHFRICTEEGASEFRRHDAHLQRRLRAIIIHQKKRARFLYRHLLRRGANPRQ